jgi:hypothetical protein
VEAVHNWHCGLDLCYFMFRGEIDGEGIMG